MDRVDLKFPSGGDECAAWLYQPAGGGPAPLIVMAHGFSATREQRLDAYAERFCAAGIGALLFDYRSFGASGGEPRQVLDIHSQQADYHAAIAFARSLDWVDADRVAAFGSSFSGGHVLAVGAQDSRLAAVVAQCPFTDGVATLPKMEPANLVKAAARGVADQLGATLVVRRSTSRRSVCPALLA
jgi:dienelactone hydrolase